MITILFFATIISSCTHKGAREDLLKIDLNSFQGKYGWGYEIKVDHKNFIRQEFIPAIPGKRGFATEAEALNTAKLVVKKMKRKESPGVSILDLKNIGININSANSSARY